MNTPELLGGLIDQRMRKANLERLLARRPEGIIKLFERGEIAP